MYKYAQLDESGVVVGISFLSGEVDSADMALLDGSREHDDNVELSWRLIGGEWLAPEIDKTEIEEGEQGDGLIGD